MLFCVILGVWIDGLILVAGARLTLVGLLVPTLGAAVVTTSGELLLTQLRLPLVAARLAAAFVAGTALTSVVMLIPTWVLHWSAQTAFLLWSGMVLAAAAKGRWWRQVSPIGWHDAGTLLLFAPLVFWLGRHLIGAQPTLNTTGVLPAWIDYFAHGTTIASFGSPLAIDAGDIMLPGTPRVFYHYGTFMLPAALSPMSGLSGLALATAVALPVGLLVGLCGLYALAAAWVGAGPALLAVWIMACVPDASHFLLHNGFYSFHWLLFATPGAGYAIGTAALAMLCAMRWFADRRAGSLLLALLLTTMLIMIRVHNFLLLAPALFAAMVLAALPRRWGAVVFVSGLLACAGLSVLLVAGLMGSEAAKLVSVAADFISFAFNNNGPPVYGAFLRQLGRGAGVLVGALLLLPAALGLWTMAMPLVVLWAVARREFRPADWIPGLLCIVYVLLIIWAPAASNGDIGEYKHRHFVQLYAVVVVWTVVRFLQLSGVARWLGTWQPRTAAMSAATCCLVTMVAYRDVDPARPSAAMDWAGVYYGVPVEPGIPGAASFIHAHARAGDLMAVGGGGANQSLRGPALELVSMTEVPSYVGRIEQAVATRPPAIVALVKRRAAEVKAADGAANQAGAFALLRAHAIRWYVVVAPDWPAWDKSGSRAIYRAGSVYVYDTESAASSGGHADRQ